MPFYKKILFSILMLLFITGTVEAFSLAALSIEAGRFLTPGRLAFFDGERAKVLTEYETGEKKVPDYVPHPYFGYVFNYEANGVSKYAERRGFPISKYGFLDDNPPLRKRSPDKVVIGVVGGSVAGWFTLYGAPVLVEKLKQSGAFAGREIEIVRLAHGGYKQPQQLIILDTLLSLGGEFDYIVNIDGWNELMVPWVELRPSDVTPFFPRQWNMYAAFMNLDPGFIEAAWSYQGSKRRWVGAARFFSRPVLRNSYTANLVWKRLDAKLAARVADDEKRLRKHRDDKRSFAAQGPGYDYGEGSAFFREAAEQWARSSILMHHAAERQGIVYLHFLQPNQYLPGSKTLTEDEKKAAYRPESEYREAGERGYPELLKKADEIRAAGVKFHDLTGIFKDNEEAVYIDVCCHFSPEGNEEMAGVIAEKLIEAAQGKTA